MIFDLLRTRGTTKILSSKELWEYLSAGSEVSSGQSVTYDSALRVATVFSCVKVLAESVGQLPLHLYRQSGRERVKAATHPLYKLLHSAPSPFQTAQEWVEMLVAHLAWRGNAFSFINRGPTGRGPVRELLPLHPDNVRMQLREDGVTPVFRVRFEDGSEDALGMDRVLHVPAFTLDGLRGVSPIGYARESLGLALAVDKHAARFFKNGATPGGVLSTDRVLSDKEYARIKESWESRHGGEGNAHRAALLEGGLKWQATGLSAEDAQMLETRKFTRSEICGLWRVPPSMVADLERATYANSEQQAQAFVDFSLMPYLTRIEQRVSLQLLEPEERGEHFARFNVRALLRGDMQARAEFYTRQVQNGALSPNEVRELEDMNPREGGDVWLTPANMLIDGKPPSSKGRTP